MDDQYQQALREWYAFRVTLGLRHLGFVLPALINFGFILANGGQGHWVPVLASLVALAAIAILLAERNDSRGAAYVIVAFLLLNMWPVIAAATAGADQ